MDINSNIQQTNIETSATINRNNNQLENSSATVTFFGPVNNNQMSGPTNDLQNVTW